MPVATVPEKPIEKSAEKPAEKLVSIVLRNKMTNANTIAGYLPDTIDPKTGLTVPGDILWDSVSYGPGSVSVPVAIAEDLKRRDNEATAADEDRLVSHERIMDLGKLDGSGYDVEKM